MNFRNELLCWFILQLFNVSLTVAWNCEKTFTYYEEYGQNSFNVTCTGITKGYEHILENITINKEISLTISDSTLDNITPNLFKNVRNIRILNLVNCVFNFDKKLTIFEKLQKLENLQIENTQFDIHNFTLKGLNNLKSLKLRNNSLFGVGTESFVELVKMERLEIIDNRITDLGKIQLCDLKNLKYLILKRNNIFTLKSYKFYCMNNNKTQIMPNLMPLNFFNIASFKHDLLEIDLSFNQIVTLGYSLENLEKLRKLNIAYNKLTNILYSNFKSLFRLQRLNLTHNNINNFDENIFINKSQLNIIDLSYNNLSNFSAADVPQLQFLDLSFNNITTISLTNITELKKLNLAGNLMLQLSSNAFEDVPKLISLNLANNRLILNVGLFDNLKELRYLYLNNNSLENIPREIFSDLENLRVLNLSGNALRNLNLSTFHSLNNLEILDLSNNYLESLDYLTVEPLMNLRNLDVASNRIRYIEYDVILSKLPQLTNINIKANQLTCEDLGKIIVFLKTRHIVYTSTEHIETLNQNVAGIPCKPAIIKNMLIAVEVPTRGPLFNFGLFLIIALGSVITGIVSILNCCSNVEFIKLPRNISNLRNILIRMV